MTKINLAELNIKQAHELLQNGSLSARELADFYLENIKKHDNKIHAYLEVFDDVLEKAGEVDREIKKGKEVPLLAGIPVAVKDNILIKNKKCSAGSKMLEGFVAPYSAGVIKKLEHEGVIFLGRTNMDEFAMGSSTENSAFGPTRNPYDLDRVPGGSSGGSAAAVAQQMSLAALGSDTGGSIRQPASFCRVVGLKPTYGAVSRFGLIAMASSFDQIGPLAKSVEDAEIIFNVIKGRDSFDATSIDGGSTSAGRSNLPVENLVLGVPKEIYDFDGENSGIDQSVVAAFQQTIETLKALGIKIKQVGLPSLKHVMEVYYIIMPAETSSNLARYDGIKYGFFKKGENLLADYMKTREHGFGAEVRRRILLGTFVLSAGYYDAYYGQAQKIRRLMRKEFEKIFSEIDIILSPTSPTPPFKIGEKIDDPVKMYLADIFTVAANLTGAPAISVPAGPGGAQFMAPWFEEEKLFNIAKILEKNL